MHKQARPNGKSGNGSGATPPHDALDPARLRARPNGEASDGSEATPPHDAPDPVRLPIKDALEPGPLPIEDALDRSLLPIDDALEPGPLPIEDANGLVPHPIEDSLDPVPLPIEDALDLHSFRPEEVSSVVEEYLLEARRAGFLEVRIIHGRGIGAQREIVRAVLGRTDFVVSFADAPPERGGWGATIASLRPSGDDT